MLSPMDDTPLHQIADTSRHVGASGRNFDDRCELPEDRARRPLSLRR